MLGNRWCSTWWLRPPNIQVAHQPPLMLRDVRTCLVKKSSRAFASMTGMPLWFGANDAPMYTPNTAS
jgi:hypothetical protein